MKLFRTISLALALTASVSYADTAAPKKAPEADAGDVKKFLAFFDKIVDAVVADKDSCPKMATDVNKIIDSNKALLDMAKKAEADGKTLPDDAKKHMMDSATKMAPAMQKCQADKDVQAAFMRLDVKKKAAK
jgi:hypothetical protein